MRSEISVSLAVEGDIGVLASIEAECFLENAWSEAALRGELSLPESVVALAKLHGEAAGYMSARVIAGEGYVGNLAVLEAFRRRGVGRALIEFINEQLELLNAEFLTLEVRQGNAAAIGLYRSLGFKEVGNRRGFYQSPPEDAVLMTRYYNQN